MVKLIALALVTGLVVSGPALAQKKDCGELKSEIEAKIKKNGVEKFTLDVVEADKQADGKVVGTCDGGTKKIVYKRGLRRASRAVSSQAAAAACAASSRPKAAR
jgi:hypothetical protein